jgi:phosphoenolpyruvate-protein kinase (PTS system EI component)
MNNKKKNEDNNFKKINQLLLRYNVTNELDKSFNNKTPKVKEISELTIDKKESSKDVKNVEYSIIKEDLSKDIARLESYQELMKSYKLNEEQFNAVSDIYNRAKENERILENVSYKSLSESAKEITNVSKRIINEISGNYIKSIDEYRSMN